MTPEALVDTGALLALLDADDRWHRPCVSTFEQLRLPLVTSTAVLAELFHLLRPWEGELRAAWSLLRSGAITVSPLDDEDLPELERLMRKYADRPMDFADAALVRLAERESLLTVFTIDFDDFETYRTGAGRALRVIPARSAG